MGIVLCREGCVQIMPGLKKVGINVGCVKVCLKQYPAASGSQIVTTGEGGVTKP